MDIIHKYYENFNFPNSKKLYTILKKEGYNFTLKEIDETLKKKEENQILKPLKKSTSGHIVAFYPNEFWNIDIFDLSKFVKYNNGFKYIFCCIDIFTRKAYCEPIKNKDETSVTYAFKKILTESNKPNVIISDSDSSFLSKTFKKLLDDKNIVFNNVIVGDHHSLAVIDRFALTLKRIIAKFRIINKSSNWVDILPKLIKTYNNTIHTSLDDLTPIEAGKDNNTPKILELNIEKSKANRTETDLKHGDKVRILEKNKNSRIGDSNYSTDIYIVDNAKLKTVVLTNGKIIKRMNLLKVDQSNVSTVDINKKITQDNKIKRYLAHEAIDTSNVIQGSRRNK